ncbi:MAG: Asp/Glu/hydantoin racemase [Acidobacteria bacterium]|nr:MAG: Asp/Glu/hydantoin racemase [Acidobacteriota bacterium]
MRKTTAALLITALALVLSSLIMAQATVSRTEESVRASRLAALKHHAMAALPVGVFDSGTGGLAVLEEVLRLDLFNNATGAAGRDGKPDFQSEDFVFLADQANMPYGNYPAAGKTQYLVDLALNDAIFLLTRDYYPAARATQPLQDRLPAKAILIACNTATAYGKKSIEGLITESGFQIGVIDVISAGARGAVERLAPGVGGTIGVIATQGTCDSNAYPEQIRFLAGQSRTGETRVVQQGSMGLAGAIDGVPEFIVENPVGSRPRPGYRGPALDHPRAPIDVSILSRYAFDFSNKRMLWDGDRARPQVLQINSIENYVAYEVVSLLETLRKQPSTRPLSTVVLGCTHFPYYAYLFQKQLRRCYHLKEDGRYIYRPVLAADVRLIDPASISGRLLYESLRADGKLGPARNRPNAQAKFYLTVPNPDYPGVQLDSAGGLTYEYKYSRSQAIGAADFRAVPLTLERLPASMARRLRRQLPAVWRLIETFSK